MQATRSPAASPCVMLLSVWSGAAGGAATAAGWHARVVLPDARSREFSSPFELAQFLSRTDCIPPYPSPSSGGLR
jgi:hypothetical protein